MNATTNLNGFAACENSDAAVSAARASGGRRVAVRFGGVAYTCDRGAANAMQAAGFEMAFLGWTFRRDGRRVVCAVTVNAAD